jgi:amidase
MARTVGDTALMLDAMAGIHPRDPRALPRPDRPFTDAVDHPKSPKKIAFSPDLGLAPVDREVVDICRDAALSFQTLGCRVEEDCPDFENAVDVFQTLRAVNYASRMAPLLEKYRDLLKPEVIWNIEKSFDLSSHDIAAAERTRGQLFHRVAAFFDDYDLLMTPTVVAPAFSKDLRYLEEVEGVKFDSYIGWLVMTFVITLTACPAISIPCGFTKDGLPVGLQVIGRCRAEEDVLSGAALFEAEHPRFFNTPIDPRP